MSESAPSTLTITEGVQFLPLYEVRTTASTAATMTFAMTDEGLQRR